MAFPFAGLRWQPLLAAVIVLHGCASQGPPTVERPGAQPMATRQVNTGSDLYPTKVGMTWHYALHSLQNAQPGPARPMRMQVVRASENNGAREAVLERFYKDAAVAPTRVISTPDRVILSRLADPAPPEGPSLTILRLPPTEGAFWSGRPLPPGNQERVQVGSWEKVVVPAGEYQALHVTHALAYANGESDSLDYWYAPGIGCVRMIETVTVYLAGKPQKLAAEGRLVGVETSDTPLAPQGNSTVPGDRSVSHGLIPSEAFQAIP